MGIYTARRTTSVPPSRPPDPMRVRSNPIFVVPLALAALAVPRIATAQGTATRITGTAISSTGEKIVGAQVQVLRSASAPAVSGEEGAFELFVLGDTTPRIVVRRIGFRPETLSVRLPQAAGSALVVRMTRTVQLIAPVVVSAKPGEGNTVLASVRERQLTGGNGYFAYRDEFTKWNPVRFSDILRRVPGIQQFRGSGRAAFTEIRLRGNRCAPLIWIDNQPLLGIPFDPDLIPPATVEAIEVYSSASLVPPQFQGPPHAQGCGALVIWTRQGERPPHTPKISADSIVRLLDAHRLYSQTEVDTPARIVTVPEPEYPDSLRGAGVSGSAVIEFIIDAEGRLNRESIGVVSATHPRFGDAVRAAVLEATFTAAQKGGRSVAQLYQLPVTFTAPRR